MATEAPASHRIQFKCLPPTPDTSESLGAPLQISARRMLGAQPGLAPKSLNQSTQVAGWKGTRLSAQMAVRFSEKRGWAGPTRRCIFSKALGGCGWGLELAPNGLLARRVTLTFGWH